MHANDRVYVCLWWWVLLEFLLLQASQVIRDFPSLPEEEASEVSLLFTTPSTYNCAPSKEQQWNIIIINNIYLWSRFSRWARRTVSPRAARISLQPNREFNHWLESMDDGLWKQRLAVYLVAFSSRGTTFTNITRVTIRTLQSIRKTLLKWRLTLNYGCSYNDNISSMSYSIAWVSFAARSSNPSNFTL